MKVKFILGSSLGQSVFKWAQIQDDAMSTRFSGLVSISKKSVECAVMHFS